MGKDSMVLRDLFASVIDGTTVNVVQSTATDLIRATVSEGTNIVPWSNSAYTYDVSGYTVLQSEGILYNFWVNTGSTLKTLDFLATGDTALSTYISGSTLTIPSGITVTEIETVTTGTTSILTNENYLKVNIFGVSGITVVNGTNGSSGVSGSSGTSAPSFTGGTTGDLNIDGTLSVFGSSGTGGWFPFGTNGNGIASANGVVTSVSFPNGIDGSFYVASLSGGTNDTLVTFLSGVLVANPM